MRHFHGTYKRVCDAHDPAWYPRMKEACDDYFMIGHRGETRGLGGIFYDDLNDRCVPQSWPLPPAPAPPRPAAAPPHPVPLRCCSDKEAIFAFAKDASSAIVESYIPIVVKHKDDPFSPRQKEWQQLRRGRYTEFNLVYDRGTIFGLKTGGRIESILMSLPLTASWRYDYQVAPESDEGKFLAAVRNPKSLSWV